MKKNAKFFVLISVLGCSTIYENRRNEFDHAQELISKNKIDEAREILRAICKQDFGAGCSVEGALSQKNKEKDFLKFYEKGCHLKDGLGCYGLASVHYRLHEGEKFKKYIKLSCEYGFTEACRSIGQLFENRLELNSK